MKVILYKSAGAGHCDYGKFVILRFLYGSAKAQNLLRAGHVNLIFFVHHNITMFSNPFNNASCHFRLSNRPHFGCLFINITIKLCNGFPIRITVFSHLFLFRMFFSDFFVLRYLLIFLCLFAASGHYKKKDTATINSFCFPMLFISVRPPFTNTFYFRIPAMRSRYLAFVVVQRPSFNL